MNEELDLSEIEERLYSQIHHSTSENTENHAMERNPNLNVNRNKRYFNSDINCGIENISVRIDVRSHGRSQGHNFKEVPYPSTIRRSRKTMNKQYNTDYDNVDLKEIKAQVDASPEFIKCLPPHIRKKLKKMNKRIAFIQKKKYLEVMKCNSARKLATAVNKPEAVPASAKKPLQYIAKTETTVTTKNIMDTVISVSDDDLTDSKINNKSIIEIPSSDEDTQPAKGTVKSIILDCIPDSLNTNVFKRPGDDDVIFVEPLAADVINLEIDSESNCSVSTKSSSAGRTSKNKKTSLEKHRILLQERNELLSTPESNNSNDFLENTVPTDNVSWVFNFGLHGTDFGPSKDAAKLSAKDVSGSESSCSVAACDLGGLLGSNKCTLFNEVDFDSISKNIFEETNMESFGDFITPNRVGNSKANRNMLQSSPLLADEVAAGSSLKKKAQNDKLPNLSSISPEDNLETYSLVENENIPSRIKKKKKPKKTLEVSTNDDEDHIEAHRDSSKKKKAKIAEQSISDDAEDCTSCSKALPKLKKKRKKGELDNQETMLSELENLEESMNLLIDSHIKKKKKNKKSHVLDDSDNVETDAIAEETAANSDAPNVLREHEPKKKKNKKSLKLDHNTDNEVDTIVRIIEETALYVTADEISKNKNKSLILGDDNSKMESSMQHLEETLINTDVESEPKKKKHKSKRNSEELFQDTVDNEAFENATDAIVDTWSEIDEFTTMKKPKSKSFTKVDDTDAVNISKTETVKRKRKRNKSGTADAFTVVDAGEHIVPSSSKIQLEISDRTEPLKKDTSESEIVGDHKMIASTSATQNDSEYIKLEARTNKMEELERHSIEDCNSCLFVSDEAISISSDSDSNSDGDNYEGADVQVVNVKFKEETETSDIDEINYRNNILNKMSDNASNWKILPADRRPAKSPKSKLRCRRCREIGHFANQCKNKLVSICCLCSGKGHLEPRCPNKLCTNCGRRSRFFTTFCSRCANTKHILCTLCKVKGHEQNTCPDLWRRYHLTISDGPIVRPATENEVPAKKWCSGCGKEGHLEYQCQYFARDHCPTLPDVINYKDHLYRGRPPVFPSASSMIPIPPVSSASTLSSVPLQVPPAASTSVRPPFLDTAPAILPPVVAIKEDLLTQPNSNNPQEVATHSTNQVGMDQPSTFKSVLPIPQPIGLNSVKDEIGMIKCETSEASLAPPTPSLPQGPPYIYPVPPLHAESSLIFPFSTQLQVTYLHAKYLRLHEAGVSTIYNLASLNEMDILIYSDGQINVRGAAESSCAAVKAAILSHLQGIRQMTIPTERLRLLYYLEELLTDLSKESTLHDLRACMAALQEDRFPNKSVHFQRLNMMIYGYFKWEYGKELSDLVKTILNTLKQSDSINDDSLKDCVCYLIDFERPIRMYLDIIEDISEGKSNFLNITSLHIPVMEQPSQKTIVIVVHPTKHDYVKSSFPVKFMLNRWKAKLDMRVYNERNKLTLVLKGTEPDVKNAFDEYRMVVAEGPALPHTKWAIFNLVSHFLQKIEPGYNHLHGDMVRLLTQDKLIKYERGNEFNWRKLHTHLILTRGLNGGREMMVILREFVENYKPSMQNDNISQHDRKQIQDALDNLQFNTNRNFYLYKRLFLSVCKNNMDKIVLKMDEYNTVKDIMEDCPWYNKLELSSPQMITSSYITISITGADEDLRNFKIYIFNYLDRVYILDSDPRTLCLKLQDALKTLWIDSNKCTLAHNIFRKIESIESKGNTSFNVENLRKLYQQLHIYLFGCCKFNSCTGVRESLNNHVYALRAYIAYLGTVNVVSNDVQMNIYETYTCIFGQEKKNEVNYKKLTQGSLKSHDKFYHIDKNTVFISDKRSKRYFTQNPKASPLLSKCTIQTNPIMQHDVMQNFVDDYFMISTNNDFNDNKNLPILIRSESVNLFSDSYAQISTNLSLSLQAIGVTKSHLDMRKALDLLNHIHALEENSPDSGLIADKYQVLNMYLFGCCYFMDGMHHLDILKTWYTNLSKPDESHKYITDSDLMDMLILSYEYIFWKGKKQDVNYRFLVNKANITTEGSITTIPLQSSHIYDYFIHVKQGNDLIQECSKKVKVDILTDLTDENKALIKLSGGSEFLPSVTDLLLDEIARIHIFKGIPLQNAHLRDYLNCKIEAVMNAENTMIPLTALRDFEAVTQQIDPSMHYTEYVKLCSKKHSLSCQLNQFIFGAAYQLEGHHNNLDTLKHLETLKIFVMELHEKPDIILDINQISYLHKSLQCLFSKNVNIDTLAKYIDDCTKMEKCKKPITKLNLLPFVYNHLKSLSNMSSFMSKKLQFQFERTSPYVLVEGSNSYLSWMRDIFCQYNKILSKVPTNRPDLIIYLTKVFKSMKQLDDPKAIWTNIGLLEQTGPSTELKELYVNLHRHLFGYHRLGIGNDVMHFLNQHLINLRILCNTSDIVCYEKLQEIFYALQYLEGSSRQYFFHQYEDFINETCTRNVSNNLCEDKSALSFQYEHSEYQCGIETVTSKIEANIVEICSPQIMQLVPSDNTFHLNQNATTAFTNILPGNEPVRNSSSVNDQHLQQTEQKIIYQDTNMAKDVCGKVQIQEKIPDGFSNYLRNVPIGKLLLNQLEALVEVNIRPFSVFLTGSINNIMIANNILRQHYKSPSSKLRTQISLRMSLMENKHVNIAELYKKTLTAGRKYRARIFRLIHSQLFGVCKLEEGQHHLNLLTNYLHSDAIEENQQIRDKIRESLAYVFGPQKKDIDYELLIRRVTGKSGK